MHYNYDLDSRGNPAHNCTTFIAGKKASATGRVLVGHNEDDNGIVMVRHGYVPAADWPEGTVLPAEPGHAAVPQAAHTYGYDWVEYKAKNGGMSNADAFYNECGVLVTSNSCTYSREDLTDASRVTDGGVAYNLRRITAERAGTAREGLMILIWLMETYGYAPSGRAYTVADKDEAFMMQCVSGKHYVAARVPDDHVVVMPNHYTFHSLTEYEEMHFPADLVDYAFDKGWYNPERDGMFDFAKTYQHPDSYLKPGSVLRGKHSLEYLGKPWSGQGGMPFSVKVDKPVTKEDFMAMLSNHYEGTEDDQRIGPGRSPHDVESITRVCTADTLESFICEFEDAPYLTTIWTAYGRPCQVPYIPTHPLVGLPEKLVTMDDPAKCMENHLKQELDVLAHQDTLWQRFHDFGSMMEMVYSDVFEEVREMRMRTHARFDKANAEVMQQARALHAEGKCAAELLRAADAQRVDEAEVAVNSVKFVTAEIKNAQPIELKKGETVTVAFDCPVVPAQDSLRFGLCRTRDHKQYAAALSLTHLGGNSYEAAFSADPVVDYGAPGLHECILGGADENGKTFTSIMMTNTIE